MKIKLAKIVTPEFDQALSQLLAVEMSAASAFQLAGAVEQLRTHKTTFEEVRQKLLDRYVEKDAGGKRKTTEDKREFLISDRTAYDKEYMALVEQDVEINQVSFKILANIKVATKVLIPLVGTLISSVAG